jgi:hypothetical protein
MTCRDRSAVSSSFAALPFWLPSSFVTELAKLPSRACPYRPSYYDSFPIISLPSSRPSRPPLPLPTTYFYTDSSHLTFYLRPFSSFISFTTSLQQIFLFPLLPHLVFVLALDNFLFDRPFRSVQTSRPSSLPLSISHRYRQPCYCFSYSLRALHVNYLTLRTSNPPWSGTGIGIGARLRRTVPYLSHLSFRLSTPPGRLPLKSWVIHPRFLSSYLSLRVTATVDTFSSLV